MAVMALGGQNEILEFFGQAKDKLIWIAAVIMGHTRIYLDIERNINCSLNYVAHLLNACKNKAAYTHFFQKAAS